MWDGLSVGCGGLSVVSVSVGNCNWRRQVVVYSKPHVPSCATCMYVLGPDARQLVANGARQLSCV